MRGRAVGYTIDRQEFLWKLLLRNSITSFASGDPRRRLRCGAVSRRLFNWRMKMRWIFAVREPWNRMCSI